MGRPNLSSLYALLGAAGFCYDVDDAYVVILELLDGTQTKKGLPDYRVVIRQPRKRKTWTGYALLDPALDLRYGPINLGTPIRLLFYAIFLQISNWA